jgi:hypothetical protein
MVVRVFGTEGSRRIERRWTLIAERGHGPEIPALTAPLLVQRILAGRSNAGARDAGAELSLSDYDAVFRSLAVRHATRDIEQPPPLYADVMGAASFAALPASLRCLHAPLRDASAIGRAKVAASRNRLAAIAARIIGFPPAGEHSVHVHFTEENGVETWTRTFGDRSFRSHLRRRRSLLVERFGPLRFAFELPSDDRGLEMVMRSWWIGWLRLPHFLAPRARAQEWEENGLFRFDVRIRLPLGGDIVHYQGWLRS